MPRRCGIDTSILVRLLTGDPDDLYERCKARLRVLIEEDDAEVFASNQVIGEAYVAVQHHYGVSKADTRAGLSSVLKSGLVKAASGRCVFAALESVGGCGLLDRLIALDYEELDLEVLTLDERMSKLPRVEHLLSRRRRNSI